MLYIFFPIFKKIKLLRSFILLIEQNAENKMLFCRLIAKINLTFRNMYIYMEECFVRYDVCALINTTKLRTIEKSFSLESIGH